LGKVSTEFSEVLSAGRLARELHVEDPLQQGTKLSQPPELQGARAVSEAPDIGSSQETGHFAEANCIAKLIQVVVRLAYVPVLYGIDEVEGGMPARQFERMLPDWSHANILSPANVV
jgi:hypothetical protein